MANSRRTFLKQAAALTAAIVIALNIKLVVDFVIG